MGRVTDAFRSAWRDFVTDGVPSSGRYNPAKNVIRDLGVIIDAELVGVAEGYTVGTNWLDLVAKPGSRNGQPGRVPTVVTGTHTGYYVNSSGTVVSGTVKNAGEYQWDMSLSAWVRTGDVIDPARLEAVDTARIAAQNVGWGVRFQAIDGGSSINAITPYGVADWALTIGQRSSIVAPVTTEARPITLSVNGGPSIPLLSNGGAAIPPGAWLAGRTYDLRLAGVTGNMWWEVVSGLDGPILNARLPSVATAPSMVPLITAADKVVLWLDKDGVNGPGLRPAGSASESKPAVATDGRSLVRLKTRLAQLRAATPGAGLKVAFFGDSWSDIVDIPRAMRAELVEHWAQGADGFHSAKNFAQIGPATLATVNFVLTDGSATSDFPVGVGPDGHALTYTGTNASITLAGAKAKEIKAFYFNHGGSFRWRVDGGAWTTVTCDESGDLSVLTIDGLTDTTHTLIIDATPNDPTKTLSFGGFYSTLGEAVEVLKLGNGGTTGERLAAYNPYVTGPLAEMAPDVAIMILATNDYNSLTSTPEVYIAALEGFAAAARAAVPDIGFIFVAPAQSGGSSVRPLSLYRDALHDWCIAQGHEYLSAYDLMGSQAQGQALGLWSDPKHLNVLGAQVLVRQITDQFFRL